MNPTRQSQMFVVFGVSAGTVLAVWAFFAIPKFQEVFVNFGAKLPLATKLLLATFRWWGIVPVVTLALWLLWPNPSKRGVAALVFGVVSAALLFLFALWAVYAPIFLLAATEG
jgi:hypothetical protein